MPPTGLHSPDCGMDLPVSSTDRKRREPRVAASSGDRPAGAPVAAPRGRGGGQNKPISDMNAGERAWLLDELARADLHPQTKVLATALVEAKELFDAVYGQGMAGVRYLRAHPPSAECVMALMTMAHENLTRQQTRAGASKSNAPKAAARLYIEEMWRAHGGEFESKTKFAEAYRDRVKRERGVDVTVKTIVDRWLKGI